MAIVKDSIAEDYILSKSERAVLRGIYRAQQLSEALQAVEKLEVALASYTTGITGNSSVPHDANFAQLKAYLATEVRGALVSTKVPSTVRPQKESKPSVNP